MHNALVQARLRFLNFLFKKSGLILDKDHWIYAKVLDRDSVIIDLGANIGDFTKQMVEKFKATYYLTEPNKSLFESIHIPAVNKFEYAITKEDGPLKFYISNNHEASSIISEFEDNWGNKSVVEVQGVTWRKFIINIGLKSDDIIDLLKVDIEGAEIELIESLTKEDLRVIKQITIEFHDWINPELHISTVRAIKKLRDNGFTIYTNTPGHNWPLEILFINNELVKLKPSDKLLLSIANKFSFLKYS